MFTDETKVKMADGSEKFIRHIKKGDRVLSYKGSGDSVEEIVMVQAPNYTLTYAVVCQGKKNEKKVIYTTLDQSILADGGEYIEVQAMRIGADLKNVGKVTGIVQSGERKVYNIQTTGDNTYYANGFVARGVGYVEDV